MVTAASCGVRPREFDELTLGEVLVIVEGAREREKRNTISRISSALRALGCAFGGKGDPFEGISDVTPPEPISPKEVKLRRFWSAGNG